jgi:hypothetical protein
MMVNLMDRDTTTSVQVAAPIPEIMDTISKVLYAHFS